MHTSRIHTALKTLALAIVIFNATGLTVVVRYCSMSESSECCCVDADRPSGQDGSTTITAERMPCFSSEIVGGLGDTKATVVPQDCPKQAAGIVVVLHTISVDALSPLHARAYHPANDVAPPLSDICISGGSLLI